MGLAALSLRKLDFSSWPRMGMDADGIIPAHANGEFRPLADDRMAASDSEMGSLRLASWARADTSFGYARENTDEFARRNFSSIATRRAGSCAGRGRRKVEELQELVARVVADANVCCSASITGDSYDGGRRSGGWRSRYAVLAGIRNCVRSSATSIHQLGLAILHRACRS